MKEPFDKPDWWPNICVEVGVSAVNQPAGVFCVVHGSYYPGFDLRFAVLKVTSERWGRVNSRDSSARWTRDLVTRTVPASNRMKRCTELIVSSVQPFMGDNYCDAINNRAFCSYDGGDCCQSTVKTKKVSGAAPGKSCWICSDLLLLFAPRPSSYERTPPSAFSSRLLAAAHPSGPAMFSNRDA